MSDDRPRTIRDGLVPLGPDDRYNGIKVSSFCMECRDQFARYEHGMQASVTLCEVDSNRLADAAVKQMDSTHVIGGGAGTADDYRAMFGIVQAPADKPATHPAPWVWDSNCGEWGFWDADGKPLVMEYHFVSDDELDPYVEAVTSAAPEMEALLRGFLHTVASLPARNLDLNLGRLYENAGSLLARIDKAREP